MTSANQALAPESERVLIVDFGSQYGQLIARRVREQNVFCQIVRHDLPAERVAELKPRGLIFSGGPAIVYAPGAPHCDPRLFDRVPRDTEVWMSHGDQVQSVNGEFVPLASTPTCPAAAVRHCSRPIYGLKFSPEVSSTPAGKRILHNFL